MRPTSLGGWPLPATLLELHGGRVQQLVHDGRGRGLEGLLLLRRQRAQPRARLLELGAADLLGAPAQLDQQRHHVERLLPVQELAHLPLDQRLGRRGLLAALAQVRLRHRLQVVEVVEEDARRACPHRGVDVARHRDVDEEQRARRGRRACARASTSSRWMTMPGRAGAADHDVGRAPAPSRSASKGAARPPSAAASSLGPLERAPAEHRGARPAAHQVARRQLAHLARADQQHVRGRAARRRSCAPAPPPRSETETALRPMPVSRARALGRGQRAVAQRVQRRAQGARLLRGLVGLLHLARGSAARRSPSSRGWPPRGRRGARPPRPRAGRDAASSSLRRAAVEARQERRHRAAARPSSAARRRPPRGCRWRGSSPRRGPRPRAAAAAPRRGRSLGKARASRTASGAVRWLTPTTTITARATATAGASVIQTKVNTTAAKPAMPQQGRPPAAPARAPRAPGSARRR